MGSWVLIQSRFCQMKNQLFHCTYGILFQKEIFLMRPGSSSLSPTPDLAPTKTTADLWFKQVDESLFKSVVSHIHKPTVVPDTFQSRNHKEGKPARYVDSEMWENLQRERENNKVLEAKKCFLRASVELSKKILKEKCEEINFLDRRINTLMEEITMMEKDHAEFEKDLDLDNLLHAELGDLSIEDIIGTLDLSFPADLIDLHFPPLNLSLQVEVARSQVTVSCLGEMREVSPLEAQKATLAVNIVKKKLRNTQQFKSNRNPTKSHKEIVKKTRKSDKKNGQAGEKLSSSCVNKKVPFAPSESLFTSQFISCPICNAIFSRSNQWMMLKHISDFHSNVINYPCQQCHKQFTCMSSLMAHGMTHFHTNSLKCCDYGYKESDLEQFVEHVENVHE